MIRLACTYSYHSDELISHTQGSKHARTEYRIRILNLNLNLNSLKSFEHTEILYGEHNTGLPTEPSPLRVKAKTKDSCQSPEDSWDGDNLLNFEDSKILGTTTTVDEDDGNFRIDEDLLEHDNFPNYNSRKMELIDPPDDKHSCPSFPEEFWNYEDFWNHADF